MKSLPEQWENPYIPLPHEPLMAAVAAYIGVPVATIKKTIDWHGEMAITPAIDRAIRAFVVTHNRGHSPNGDDDERHNGPTAQEDRDSGERGPDDGGEPTDLRERERNEASGGGSDGHVRSARAMAERLSRYGEDRD